jgi:hypothetical protein
MATPYEYPTYFDPDAVADGGSPDPGTALLFPPLAGVAAFDVSSPDLSRAVSALYFNDQTRWPSTDAGTLIALPERLVDSPDGAAVANWIASEHGWLPGIPISVPTTEANTDNEAPGHAENDWFLDNEGTIPYVNPANTNNPDAIFALNWLLDNLA